MASTADFRNGFTFKYNNDLVSIIEFQHVKPGKGPAFVRTKLRSLNSGKVLENTFNAGVKIDEVRIERRKYQYLYAEGEGFHFMNAETFEQVFIPAVMVETPGFLTEGLNVEILFHAEEELPLQVDLPNTIEADVVYTEPGIKGDTATNTLKPAKIDTGVEIKVPLFVNIGDRIKVDTKTKAYVERVKS
jgi:elongation factor P